MKLDVGKVREDLGSYLFDVYGFPGVPKRVAFVSHEHLDHVPIVMDLAAHRDVTVYSSKEVFRILEKKLRYWSNLKPLDLKLMETFMLYRLNVKFRFDDVTMIRAEHVHSDAFFIFHHGKVLFLSEASGSYIRRYIKDLTEEFQPEYVVMSIPSYVHKIYPEDVEFVKGFCENVVLTAPFLKNPMLSQDVTRRFRLLLPKGCLVLPKVLRSYLDVFPLL